MVRPQLLSIYLSKSLYRELGMVRRQQEFFNVQEEPLFEK